MPRGLDGMVVRFFLSVLTLVALTSAAHRRASYGGEQWSGGGADRLHEPRRNGGEVWRGGGADRRHEPRRNGGEVRRGGEASGPRRLSLQSLSVVAGRGCSTGAPADYRDCCPYNITTSTDLDRVPRNLTAAFLVFSADHSVVFARGTLPAGIVSSCIRCFIIIIIGSVL